MPKPPTLTPDDLAPLLQKLEEHEARLFDHDALLGEHEERITALESTPVPPALPEDAPD